MGGVTLGKHTSEPMTLSHLTVSDLKRSTSRSLGFRSSISHKGELGHMLLLNINRKTCTSSPLVRLHLTFVTLKGECHLDFKGLYLVKAPS